MPRRDDDEARRDQRELNSDSEKLLKAIGELRELEQRKRREPMSSLPFRDLAQRVEDKAREVYRLADEEADDAKEAATDRSQSTADEQDH